MTKRDIFPLVRFVLYFIFIIFFAMIPVAYFMEGDGCALQQMFHIIGPTCGVTRSFTFLLDGDLVNSLKYNGYLILFLAPFSFFTMAQDVWTFVWRKITKKERASFLEMMIGIK